MDDFVPSPEPTELTAPFWAASLRDELRLQACTECRHIRYPIAPICPRCLSAGYTWQALSGRGQVQSFVVFDRAYQPSWEDRVPYVVALIELDEGPVMISNVVHEEPDDVRVGQRVVATYDVRGPAGALVQFRPNHDGGPS